MKTFLFWTLFVLATVAITLDSTIEFFGGWVCVEWLIVAVIAFVCCLISAIRG